VKQGLLGEAWNNCGKTSRHSQADRAKDRSVCEPLAVNSQRRLACITDISGEYINNRLDYGVLVIQSCLSVDTLHGLICRQVAIGIKGKGWHRL